LDYFAHPELIRVYPNPTQGNIQLRINQFVGKLHIQLVDTNGRLVYEEKDTAFQLEKTLPFGALQKGVYVLKVSGDQLKYTQKIIIN
jgi:hypothetical protein